MVTGRSLSKYIMYKVFMSVVAFIGTQPTEILAYECKHTDAHSGLQQNYSYSKSQKKSQTSVRGEYLDYDIYIHAL